MKENFEMYLSSLELKSSSENLLKYLRAINKDYGHISYPMISELGKFLNLEPSHIQGVASFYHFIDISDFPSRYKIRLCKTLSCHSEKGREKLIEHIKNKLNLNFGEKNKDYSLDYTSCMGLCDLGPALMINDKIYTKINEEKFDEIIEDLKNGRDKLLPEKSNIANSTFLLEKEEIDIKKILSIPREVLLNYVLESNIKGRGGAGFPIGLKLKSLMVEDRKEKYIVCNGDEGEPGTFKDRMLLEENSLLLVYGIICAMYITNSHKAYIYIRGEYNYLEDKLIKSIEKTKTVFEEANINFDFDIEVFFGLGAYICGEETALIESLEGKRGEARNRPPYPADVGYLESATAVNNIETLCTMAKVLNKMIENKEYIKSKLFSISGDLENKGVYEINLDSKISDILDKAEISEDKILIYGGASGAFIYKDNFDLNILDKKLPFAGSIYVLEKDRDIFEVIENIIDFFHRESCGQCTPCREGLEVILGLIKEYRNGNADKLEDIENLAHIIKNASKCGLGQSSCNLLLSHLSRGVK